MRVAVAMVAAVLMLLASACTPDPGPQPTPTVVSPTPTENAQEREQRLAYEAAEKSYREFQADYRRALREGGASSATSVMKATAGDGYLDVFTEVLRANKKLHVRQVGEGLIGYVRPAGYTPDSVLLDVCEDQRKVQEVRSDGKKPQSGEVRVARLEVRKVGGTWKVWTGTGKRVDSCDA